MDDVSETSPLENCLRFAVNSRCKGTRDYPGVAEIGQELVLTPDPNNCYSKTSLCWQFVIVATFFTSLCIVCDHRSTFCVGNEHRNWCQNWSCM